MILSLLLVKPMNYTERYHTITEYMVDINVYVQ